MVRFRGNVYSPVGGGSRGGFLSPQLALTHPRGHGVASVQSTTSLIFILGFAVVTKMTVREIVNLVIHCATAWTLGLFYGSADLHTERGHIIVVRRVF